MIDYKQFKDEIVEPLFEEMSNYSERAVLAAMMCVAHESKGCAFLIQDGVSDEYMVNNPLKYGIGPFQMEGWVHNDTWDNADNIVKDAFELGFINDLHYRPKPRRMIHDLRYAAFMFRKRLHMDINPLPESEIEMSHYLKKYWNSERGAATPWDYLNDHKQWENA